MKNDERTAILGDEYDEQLREVLLEVLRELGAGAGTYDRGVAGSQELETLNVELGGKILRVEAETYVGLSVRGDRALVNRVELMVKARMQAHR